MREVLGDGIHPLLKIVRGWLFDYLKNELVVPFKR